MSIKNHVEAKNTLVDIINRLMPELQEYYKNNEVQYKADGSFFKKDGANIDKIVNKHIHRHNVRCYVNTSNYGNDCLNTDISYTNDRGTCTFISSYIDIKEMFNPLQHITEEDVITWEKELLRQESLLHESKSKINELKRKLDL